MSFARSSSNRSDCGGRPGIALSRNPVQGSDRPAAVSRHSSSDRSFLYSDSGSPRAFTQETAPRARNAGGGQSKRAPFRESAVAIREWRVRDSHGLSRRSNSIFVAQLRPGAHSETARRCTAPFDPHSASRRPSTARSFKDRQPIATTASAFAAHWYCLRHSVGTTEMPTVTVPELAPAFRARVPLYEQLTNVFADTPNLSCEAGSSTNWFAASY